MSKPEITPTPTPTLEERMKAQREALVGAIEQARLQLNGLTNQLYIIDQLLNPAPSSEPESASPPAPDGMI